MDIPLDSVGTFLAGVSFVVGIATAYLRLFVSKEISHLKDDLTDATDTKLDRMRNEVNAKFDHMLQEFHPKEIIDERLRSIQVEVNYLKRWLDLIRGSKISNVSDNE